MAILVSFFNEADSLAGSVAKISDGYTKVNSSLADFLRGAK